MNRRTTALMAAAVLGSVALVSGCSDEGKPVSFDNPGASSAPAPKGSGGTGSGQDKAPNEKTSEVTSKTLLPTGPKAQFTTQNTLEDGTKIGVTTLHGKKSGFTGKVWVWAPKQYFDPKYAKSGFPVLIALPGGNGYPKNYWMGTDLKLQSSITEWSKQGKSVPFVVVMPVLNPDAKYYYDGSDIPGHPKMGTWMTEDVPDFVKANFRTFKSRDGWAFMGSSSGGFVGLKSVLKRPDQFKAVIASGPDTVPDSPLWAGHEAEKQANNPEKLAQDLIDKKGPEVDLAFQIGTKEGGMANLNGFIAKYGKGPVKTRLQVIQGGKHNAHTYIKGMGDGTMQWISSKLQAPIPSS
ncbi:alpha/beta hydrolase-fold protein [Streptomyces sp. BPTC-684]|uniref:alpha/beta hydrolase n=1 Tax=Streptomyces sp. BPTC-684 TaxID=3043734 RepID=UPI0024B1E3A4|nr:alpha/beta hydrolase-fold protein [Streptomyces sp. BPTC-684]WHM37259.1 alpha/beta hydrolase-fold protein [Streptomyces sp. BPTC-684]